MNNGWSQIDVQLRRRYDLIPNLVETVQGYATHEREVFERVTEARARAIGASGVGDQASAENAITAGLRQLLAVAENYPDLKANQNFLALQEELTGHRVEDRLRPAVLQRPGDEAEHGDPVVPLEPRGRRRSGSRRASSSTSRTRSAGRSRWIS